jgi:hypothetical protein
VEDPEFVDLGPSEVGTDERTFATVRKNARARDDPRDQVTGAGGAVRFKHMLENIHLQGAGLSTLGAANTPARWQFANRAAVGALQNNATSHG